MLLASGGRWHGLLRFQPGGSDGTGRRRLPRWRERRPLQGRSQAGSYRWRRDLVGGHVQRPRRVPPQPSRNFAACRGRPALRQHFERRGRIAHQRSVSARPELSGPEPQDRRGRMGGQLSRARYPARPMVFASVRIRRGQEPSNIRRRRWLAVQLRAGNRRSDLEIRRQPERIGMEAREGATATTSLRRRSFSMARSTSRSAKTPSTARASGTSGPWTPRGAET